MVVRTGAYARLNGRLFVSVTQFVRTNVVISEWTSNLQVKKVVMASCMIPLAMLRPVWLREVGCLAIDGGFSHNHPRIDEETVLVSPARTP